MPTNTTNTVLPPTTPDPAAMRRRARVMKAINVPMRAVVGLPFPTPLNRRLMVITHRGRRTGHTYRQPVSYVRDGDVLLTPGGGGWTRNLRDGEPVPIRLRGRRTTARAERVRDADEVERLLNRMVAANPRLTSFVPFLEQASHTAPEGVAGSVRRDKLEAALAYGFCVVRWHVVDGEGRS